MQLLAIWRRVFSTRYSAIMEAEVARLRAENRALLNSILGIAGVPPITVSAEAPATASGPPPRSAEGSGGAKRSGPSGTSSAKNGVSVATPTRRRSWHQVYRMLEIDAARKKESV